MATDAAVRKHPPEAGRTNISYRALATTEEYAQCVELQRMTWGYDFADVVPAAILQVTQKVGGVAAGAFDEDGRMLGFVYGMTGVRGGRLAHWSHMLAVRQEAQGLGIGRHLKEFQRELLTGVGVAVLYWTFDPLVARNAHFNMNRLGVQVVDYVPDMYGNTGSELHRLGTDRFVVAWEIGTAASPAATPGASGWPLANPSVDGHPQVGPPDDGFPRAKGVRIAIPGDIDALQEVSMAESRAWRDSTRAAITWYLARGYRVHGFARAEDGGDCFYALEAGPEETT